MAVAKDFTRVQGDTLPFRFTITDAAGDAVDLAGIAEAVLTIKQDGAAVLEKTKSGGGVVFATPLADGVITARVTDEETALLSGDFDYQLRLTDTAGDSQTARLSAFELKPGL